MIGLFCGDLHEVMELMELMELIQGSYLINLIRSAKLSAPRQAQEPSLPNGPMPTAILFGWGREGEASEDGEARLSRRKQNPLASRIPRKY